MFRECANKNNIISLSILLKDILDWRL